MPKLEAYTQHPKERAKSQMSMIKRKNRQLFRNRSTKKYRSQERRKRGIKASKAKRVLHLLLENIIIALRTVFVEYKVLRHPFHKLLLVGLFQRSSLGYPLWYTRAPRRRTLRMKSRPSLFIN
jgi:hypothetical protein